MTDTITTELRESMVDDARGLLYIGETAFADLCDAIDAVHANLEAENESLRRELDRVLGEQEDRDGWIELPKDMNGEYIHVGDVMDSRVDYLFDGKPFTVCALVLCEDGWEVADGRFGNRYEPDSLRHHHEPTVEDVLFEFAQFWSDEELTDIEHLQPDAAQTIAEYAARLRLAGDGA